MQLSFGNVDRLCSDVDFQQSTPSLDLSDVRFIEPFALIYLGMFLRFHNANGHELTVMPPTNTEVRNYLARQNFWERFNLDPEVIEREKLQRFTTSTSFNDIVDIENKLDIGDDIAYSVRDILIRENVNVDIEGVESLVSELVDNFERHSRSEHTLAAIAVQYYPNMKRLDIAIGDCGVGIRTSLADNPQYGYLANHSHHDAIREAFKPLVSGRIQGGGMGLSEVKDTIQDMNGSLILSSGDGYFKMNANAEEYGLMYYDLSGVQVSLSVPEEGQR